MRPPSPTGDWLLVDPTDRPLAATRLDRRLPRTGRRRHSRSSASRPARATGSPFADGYLELAEDEAWLLSDATTEATAAAGFGEPIDSRQYGPVPSSCSSGGPGSGMRRFGASAGSRAPAEGSSQPAAPI